MTTDVFEPALVQRMVMCVEYDGSAFQGWQFQKHTEQTVQQQLEQAIGFVANHEVKVFCAGRTDSGVHGSGQIIHFDTTAKRDGRAWTLGVNTKLPKHISIRWVQVVDRDFHARFMATARRYRYVIYTAPFCPAILHDFVSWTFKSLDVQRMSEAAQCLVGTHDFSAFRAADCQAKSPVKTIHHLRVYQEGQLIVLDIKANSFLYHMVRNIAGVLMRIGAGENSVEWCAQVLASQNRKHEGITAKGNGLYFSEVSYPEQYVFPKHPLGPFFLSDTEDAK